MQGHIGCVEARALLEPGPSFCWGPALEGPTSPSSSLFDAGQVDEINARCAARAPCPPLRAPQPPRPPHAPIPPPCTAHTSLARLTTASPLCTRAQELDFALLPRLPRPESRVARQDDAVAARRRRHGPRGPCERSGAQGAVKGVGVAAPRLGSRLGPKQAV